MDDFSPTVPLISVVIPLYNEGSHVKGLLADLKTALQEIGCRFEVVLVDDGSSDNTWAEIKDQARMWPDLRAIRLSRNFGKELALCAGLERGRGDAVIVMDGDGQHPPSLLPLLIERWRTSGADIVEAVKRRRGRESLASKFGALTFYVILNKLSGFELKGASDFKLIDRRVLDTWLAMRERNVFFRGMTAWMGFRTIQVPFEVGPRRAGKSGWSYLRRAKLALIGITTFSSFPLHFVTFAGVIFFIFAVGLGIQTLYLKLAGRALTGFATVILLELIIGSLLMISLGIIGEYLARIYEEVKGRPRYIVTESIDLADGKTRLPPPGIVVPGPRTMAEKNAGSRANNAAESLRTWLPPALVFAVVLLVIFWRLGSYPPYFNDVVDHGIHMEANKVFDHADISNRVNWYWKDMHSIGAYESPLYGMVIELGLRLFGLTLFGVRFFPALIEFGALILTFFAFRKYFPQYLLLSFILLMALSPWHLLVARSGGIQGFSVSQYLIALSMFVLLIDRKRSVGLAILAGISTATIPYGYAGIRLLLPSLVLLAIVCFRRIEKYNLFAYLGTILAICAIQIGDFPRSLQMYFYARGENLISVGRRLPNGGYDFAFIAHKLNENFHLLFKMIMGLNEKAFWNVNVASTMTPIADVVLYPKFLVPLFIVGLVYSLAHAYKQKRFILAMPVLLLLPGLVTNMMSGMGIPNLTRSIMLLVPIYFLITYGAYSLFCSIYTISSDRLRAAFSGLFAVFVGLVSAYQVNNYFHYEKDTIHGGKNDAAMVMYNEFLKPYMAGHPNSRILYHEFGPFDEWSYVVVRWLGGKRVQTMRDEGKLVFLTNDNRASMDRLLKQGYFDIVVSAYPDQLEQMLPDTKAMKAEISPPGYKVYYIKR